MNVDGTLTPVEALEPFAAMARMIQASIIFSGGKANCDTIVASAQSEVGQCVLTYGHFLDALDAFPGQPRGWSGRYNGPQRAASVDTHAKRGDAVAAPSLMGSAVGESRDAQIPTQDQ